MMKISIHPGRSLFDNKGLNKKGVALILTLWVLVLLTVIVAEFSTFMKTEINIARNFKEETESYYLALAGIEKAIDEILSPSVIQCLDEKGNLIFRELGKADEEVKEPPQREDLKLGSGTYSYKIIDEESKVNLNTATPEMLKNLFMASGVKGDTLDIIVDSILDWRDPDNLHRLNGAEDDYYQSLPVPYSSKDGNFDTVEELFLVKGITPEIFFGTPGKEGEDSYKGVYRLLTTKSSGLININTAPREVLTAMYGDVSAESIITQREQKLCSSIPVTGVPNAVLQSTHFTIISVGGGKGSTHRVVKAIVEKGPDRVRYLYWNDNFFDNRS